MDTNLFYYHLAMLSLGIFTGKPDAMESAKFLASQNLMQNETNEIVNMFINSRYRVSKDNIEFVNSLCDTLQLKERDIIKFAYEFEKNKDNYKLIKTSVLKLEYIDLSCYPQYIDIFNEILRLAIMMQDEDLIEYVVGKIRRTINE